MGLMKTIDREQILRILQQNSARFQSFGVKSLAVFGSVARGEASAQSDVDILVSFEEAATFDKYMDLKIYLEDQLNCTVDLIVAEALHKRLQPYVEQEAVYVT
jgi:predicted nucleotidyltransferase